MAIDRYTKAVLTVIAGCLLFLCAMSAGRAVDAQQLAPVSDAMVARQPATPVVIVGWGEMGRDGRVQLVMKRSGDATDAAVPVKLPSGPVPVSVAAPVTVDGTVHVIGDPARPLPVGVTEVRKAGDWEPLRVSVEPAGTRKTPGEIR